jgi:predicted transcriptional regulator
MRTTIDLPTDLHTAAKELAHREGKTLSEVVAELVRRGLKPASKEGLAANHVGLPTVSVGRIVTQEDVRSLDDE